MSFSREMLAMMPRTITVNAFSSLSTDGYGVRTYSTDSKSVKCYIEDKTVLVRDPVNGGETVSTRQLYCAPYDTSTSGPVTIRIQISDKVTLPSGFNPQTPLVINVVHYDDRGGYYAQVCYL